MTYPSCYQEFDEWMTELETMKWKVRQSHFLVSLDLYWGDWKACWRLMNPYGRVKRENDWAWINICEAELMSVYTCVCLERFDWWLTSGQEFEFK